MHFVIRIRTSLNRLSLQWTVSGQSGWSMGLNWTILTSDSEFSCIKLVGSKDWKWTVCESGWTWNQKLGLKNFQPSTLALLSSLMDRPLSNLWTVQIHAVISMDRSLKHISTAYCKTSLSSWTIRFDENDCSIWLNTAHFWIDRWFSAVWTVYSELNPRGR